MRVITNLAGVLTSFALTVFGGSLLFGAGALSAVGWLVAIPLFVGAITCTGIGIYNLFPKGEKKADNATKKAEIDTKQTATGTEQ
jgi:hypothetical protein